MGFGDVRLAAVLGLYLGWINIRLPLISLFFACIIGVVLGLGYRMIVRDGSKFFPFGPGLAIGALGGDLVLAAPRRLRQHLSRLGGRAPAGHGAFVVVGAGTVVAGGSVVVVATGNMGRIAAST